MRPVCLLVVFVLFVLLCLMVWLGFNVLVLLKEPSRGRGPLALHVVTDVQFLLQKTWGMSCMDVSGCVWCAGLFVGQHLFWFNARLC